MKTIAFIILKYAGILLALFTVTYWIIFYSPLNVPEYIPNTPIKIYGLCLVSFMLTILIFSQKQLLRKNPNFKILDLTLIGTAIGFLHELMFQFFLSFTEISDKLHYFITGVITAFFFYALLSFFVAFQLKTKKTGQLVLFILAIGILIQLINWIFPELKITKS